MIWNRLFSRNRRSEPRPPPKPDEPFVAIGDVHGRADLLARLLARLDPSLQVVCVGDYVDRGEHSAEVLQMLMARDDIVCLGGNHEEMLLGFLSDPVRYGKPWLRSGGLQALASFGVSGVTETSGEAALREARDSLRAAMGAELVEWMSALPLFWMSGNVAVVHAGADPALPIPQQRPGVLRWGHPGFAGTPREDGLWVVHGHVIVDNPVMADGRIAIDTGAYATGKLTAALIDGQCVEFMTA